MYARIVRLLAAIFSYIDFASLLNSIPLLTQEAVALLRQFKALELQLAAQATKDLFAAAVKGDLAAGECRASCALYLMIFPILAQAAIGKGASVSAQSEGGYTALHAACRNGHIEVVRLLLASDADPTIDTDFNKDARQVAEKQGQ